MTKNRIVAPAFGFFKLGDDFKLTPDQFAQRDTLPPGTGFGTGAQVFWQQNSCAVHIHSITLMDMDVKMPRRDDRRSNENH